jgi:hypothetical protein
VRSQIDKFNQRKVHDNLARAQLPHACFDAFFFISLCRARGLRRDCARDHALRGARMRVRSSARIARKQLARRARSADALHQRPAPASRSFA